jgi:hypothetical protein
MYGNLKTFTELCLYFRGEAEQQSGAFIPTHSINLRIHSTVLYDY